MNPKKYGKVPTEEVHAFGHHGQEGDTYSPSNVSDLVFADKLADTDDPRELHVRRDLSYRTGNYDGYLRNITKARNNIANNEPEEHQLSDGTLLTTHTVGERKRPRFYTHYWQMPNDTMYGAILNPQEHEEMMSKLRSEGLLQDAPQQMSRSPLVVSYRRKATKYAASTVARVMGHGQYGSEIAPINQGSRLATVLREIKHGVGKTNPILDKLTTHALGGTHKPEVYTAIRDELFRSKDPRAVQLARQYNWHKVGEGLERDRYLKQFVENSAKGTSHEGHSQQFRRFYNGVVHGKNGPDDNTRQLFYKAMRKHLQDSTGKDHSYEDIENSLRRLGETEENKEKLGGGKGGAKFEVPDYEHPAYTGVPKEGKAPPKRQITPIERRAPGQYRRNSFRFKL